MLFDTIDHAEQYREAFPAVYRVLQELKKYSAEAFPTGSAELPGGSFLKFNEYETKSPEGAATEAHRSYIDVFYLLEGSETVYVKPTADLRKITMPYDAGKDCLLAETDDDVSAVVMTKGSFLVLFPQDAHCPGRFGPKGAAHVKKIIGKVPV